MLIAVLSFSQATFTFKQPWPKKSAIEKAAEMVQKKQVLAEAAWAMQRNLLL